jgi:hypothetical protein
MSSVAKWQDFKLSDLFNCTRGTRLTVENRELGNIPLVTAGEDNLGVKAFISNENQAIFSNSITIDMFCNSYTHIDKFCCDDNIIVLSAKTPLNKFIMLFINTLIKQDKYRYQYGRQYRLKHFNNHYIKLPATEEGSPDWQYMENYIKQLSYSDKI